MPNDPYARYQTDAIATASPARLVTLLYDHLALDLARAERAVESQEVAGAHTALVHAQRIVSLLRSTLREDLWEGAADLLKLYSFLYAELVRANLYKDVERVRDCARLVEPLQMAWHAAAAKSGEEPAEESLTAGVA